MAEDPPNGRLPAGRAIAEARTLVEELAGRRPESVSGISHGEDGGWTVSVDVVELSRVPPSTDLLATYEVILDSGGDLVELTRARRYVRGQADED
jgi:hypothetical protein